MSEEEREQGVGFEGLMAKLEDETYPISNEELLERYGDHEITVPDGSQPINAVLEPAEEMEYDDAEAVKHAILNMIGNEAIERQDYSDRGSAPTEGGDESF